ncbi:MAG: hypothetical protein EOO71_02130 [Myxococcaceae bacterium]|nr:MAG: hypothetical protein EOO71_02130 [Myxococcaceae bacterium]
MGNASGREKPKPLIVGGSPSVDPGAFKVTFSMQADHELGTLKESDKPNAFHLPWRDGACTECEIPLDSTHIEYFFTANLSGCSLWYKFNDGNIVIRHEARGDPVVQNQHRIAGFKCVVDSRLNPDDIQLVVDPETHLRTSRFYVVYALLDHDARSIDFRPQHVQQTKNLFSKVESYELLKSSSIVVPFPEL